MQRRKIISLTVGAMVALPFAGRSQTPSIPVIGFLGNATPALWADRLLAFRNGLAEAGFVEGRNVRVEYRWAEDKVDRLRGLADDLVQRGVSVIAAGSLLAAKAAKAATTTIPVVFCLSADPVKEGLVASLNRPGGNLTGATNLNEEVMPKRIELLLECVPAARNIALLANPTYPGMEAQAKALQKVVTANGRQLHVLLASNEEEIDKAFGTLRKLRAEALVINTDPFFTSRREKLAKLTVSHAIPSVYQYREFAAHGGLLSFGGSLTEMYRLNGHYVGRILKGEKASDLPVQQDMRFDILVNLGTAKALKIKIPQSILVRANEVIE